MTRARYAFIKAAAMLPARVLWVLSRSAPLWRDDPDGWSVWTDAHYHRYCRFDAALWGWRQV